MVDRLSLIGLFRCGIGIKGSQDIQAIGVKAMVAQQCLPQFSRTDQHGVGGVVIAQKLLNVFDEAFSEIADLGSAAIRDHRQVFTNLHFAHAQSIGQGSSGNIGRASRRDAAQIGHIAGQPLENRFGNFFTLHVYDTVFLIDTILYR